MSNSKTEDFAIAEPEAIAPIGHDGNLAELTDREREMLRMEAEINARLDQKLNEKGAELLWPKACYFIVPNEFGERFAYYGIKPLFAHYLTNMVGMRAVDATIWTSNFTTMAYFFPLGGAALSDSFLGKYWTIVSLSVVYAIGTILLAVFSIPGLVSYNGVTRDGLGALPFWTWLFPVVLMALGTGGIKPCVSSHGGDQYLPHQTKGLNFFFSYFYVAINLGSLISGYLTPYLKQGILCFNRECYFISYIVCAAVFTVVMILFAVGKPWYRIVPPRGEFLPYKAVKAAAYAAYKWTGATREEREAKGNWLNFGEELVGPEFVIETRLFGNNFMMMLPTLFFWMCYDQGSNEWQFQYDMMKNTGIPPEAFSNLNPIFIVIMVPTFNYLYRVLERRNIRFTVLQRMGTGFFLMVLAYLISGILQIYVIRAYDPVNDPDNLNCINGWWQVPQWFILSLGETLLSPEGLKFAYANSGRQMRSQNQSVWLLMSALGDLVTSAVNQSLANNPAFNDSTSLQAITPSNIAADGSISQPAKYWLFTALCFAFNVWFVLWAKFVYKYKDVDGAMTAVPTKAERAALETERKEIIAEREAIQEGRVYGEEKI
ncbi:hypothetical protein BZG36_05340 [Bifiguratus adelaidae]|uniref:Peptide transporter PTR2 n=1 Tax=Bifiguratus adelaidae TaxID=1938954 RepID=A0A261XU28_9FUNG|nr:hypothetical protein BZG36_05340 [Bifiguratus adelaidae]